MFFVFLHFSTSVIYFLTGPELVISEPGIITKQGVRSKGYFEKITSVTINEGPTEIEKKAFENFFSLVTVHIPVSIAKINFQPFMNCPKLTNINVNPNNQHFLSDNQHALYSHDKKLLIKPPMIKDIIIPEPVESIEEFAFVGDSFRFGAIVLPKTLTTLSVYSFYACGFESISFAQNSIIETLWGFNWCHADFLKIPPSVTKINPDTFYNGYIKEYIFESGSKLKELGEFAFRGAKAVKSFTLPDGVDTICNGAFESSSAEIINIGTQCSNISMTAFTGCNLLTKVNISKDNNFYKTENEIVLDKAGEQIIFIPVTKKELIIASTVKIIGQTLLQSCSNLLTLTVESPTWKTENGVLYSENYEELIAVCGGVKNVTVRPEVITIRNYSAYSCTNLVNFSFSGNAVTSIGKYAFSKSAIYSIKLPDSVVFLNQSAFESTPNLWKFEIGPESQLRIIDTDCFHVTYALQSFTFRKNVELIAIGSFLSTGLREITFDEGINLNYTGLYSFEKSQIVHLKLPESLLIISERTFNRIECLETVEFHKNSKLIKIENEAFGYCKNIVSIELPSSCEEIGANSFRNCTKLSSFKNNLRIIGNLAFDNCTSLLNFNFSSRQENYQPDMFQGCIYLVRFSFPEENPNYKENVNSVFTSDGKTLVLFPPGRNTAIIPPETEKFADNAFAWSPCLTNVAFNSGSSLTTIGNSAFFQCTKLKIIQFPPVLKTIGKTSFSGCTSLKSIILPSSLSSIGEYAFSECTCLKHVIYCGTNEVEGTNVFESSIVVYVTDLYPSEEFCSNKVERKLDYDCQIKKKFLPSCENHKSPITISIPICSFLLLNVE